MTQPTPQALSHLVALNVEYGVLICIGNGCHYALKPTAISRHLGDKHKTPIELRKQVDQYVKEFPLTLTLTLTLSNLELTYLRLRVSPL
jgi:hypothetical protein